MEPDLTDDELRTERKRAEKFAKLCDGAGEPDSSAHYWSVIRAIDVELLNRGITL